MKKFKKIVALALAAMAAVSAMSMSAMAAELEIPENRVLSGKAGDVYKSGNLIYEFVETDKSPFGMNEGISTYSSQQPWSITISPSEGKTSYNRTFTLRSGYKFWKVWFKNNQSENEHTIISVTKPNGDLYEEPVTVYGQSDALNIHIDENGTSETGNYKVSLTSGHANINAQLATRIATTYAELDIDAE